MQVILTEKEYNELKRKADKLDNSSCYQLAQFLIDKVNWNHEITSNDSFKYESKNETRDEWVGEGLPFHSVGKFITKTFYYELTIKKIYVEQDD